MSSTLTELLLLLLLGVSSTTIAFAVDKSIDVLGAARAHAAQDGTTFFTSYVIWTGSALLLCTLSVAVVQNIGPSAAGSGIPQMKCVLAGVHIQDYLSLRTLVAKALSLVLALAGGLSIGKEGPYVHMASCAAQLLCGLQPFRWIGSNEHLRRQVLAAGCAAGVSATFGAPVGGVLFSIEVTSTYYSISHLWKAMFTAVCGSVLFHVTRDYGELALFQLTNFNVQEQGQVLFNGEMFAFTLLGVVCGLMGASFVHATSSLVLFIRQLRKPSESDQQRWCSLQNFLALLLSRYGYTFVVAFTSAMLTFPFGFFRSSPEEVINELFGAAPFDFSARWANPSLIVNLLIYVVCKFVFTVIAVGCPISCGVFTPVFLIGAATGRCFGEVLNRFMPPELQVTAGGYAVVGAAAMAAGVTRTVSCAVMVFELTGQLNHMLPVLVAVLAAYGVGNMINKSIYDTMLELNNLPYLEPPQLLEDSKRTACDVMDRNISSLNCQSTYLDALVLLHQSKEAEFPVIHDDSGQILIGSVLRSTLQQMISAQLNGPLTQISISRQTRQLDQTSDIFRNESGWLGLNSGFKAMQQLMPKAEGQIVPAAENAVLDSHFVMHNILNHAQIAHCESTLALRSTATSSSIDDVSKGKGAHEPSCPAVIAMDGQSGAVVACDDQRWQALGHKHDREVVASEFNEGELQLLKLPLQFGINSQEILQSSVFCKEAWPTDLLINLAPNVIMAGTPLQQVHMQFSLLGIERAYVTFGGRLLGNIRRAHLSISHRTQ